MLDLTDFAVQERPEGNLMVAISRPWYNCSYTMAAKPIKSLELHYTMMQFLIIIIIRYNYLMNNPITIGYNYSWINKYPIIIGYNFLIFNPKIIGCSYLIYKYYYESRFDPNTEKQLLEFITPQEQLDLFIIIITACFSSTITLNYKKWMRKFCHSPTS